VQWLLSLSSNHSSVSLESLVCLSSNDRCVVCDLCLTCVMHPHHEWYDACASWVVRRMRIMSSVMHVHEPYRPSHLRRDLHVHARQKTKGVMLIDMKGVPILPIHWGYCANRWREERTTVCSWKPPFFFVLRCGKFSLKNMRWAIESVRTNLLIIRRKQNTC